MAICMLEKPEKPEVANSMKPDDSAVPVWLSRVIVFKTQ